MTSRWKNSDRKQRLPVDWQRRRKEVLRRDSNRCQLRWLGCEVEAKEVDHIVAGDNHDLENLQAVCSSCHGKKSSSEGFRALQRLRKKRFRQVEKHPGLRKVG